MRMIGSAMALAFLLQMALLPDLWAFSITESRIFSEGPNLFKIEVQVNGRGRVKKRPSQISSLKVKIKNEKASSAILKVRTVRIYTQSNVYQDIETVGYSITPGQWVTKYYRLRKEKQPLMSDEGYVEIAFENFAILFHPWERRFSGPRI